MISFDEAIAIISGVSQPLGNKRVELAQAAGRVLAAPVVAAIDSPRTNVSAMDGYAVREDDFAGAQVLQSRGARHQLALWRKNRGDSNQILGGDAGVP